MTCCCTPSGGGFSPSDSSSEKSLFSIWTRYDNAITLNLQNIVFNTTYLSGMTFSGGARCTFNIKLTGTEAVGNAIISSSSYDSGTGSGDPGCASLAQTYSFTKPASILNLCNASSQCANYN